MDEEIGDKMIGRSAISLLGIMLYMNLRRQKALISNGLRFKPFAILTLRFKPVVPVCFNANRIIRTDFVHLVGSFGKLDGKFVFASSRRVASADL